MSQTFFTPGPSALPAHSWALSVFRVEDQVAQQRVLRALRRLGRADLSAIGTQRGSETFVIIDWDAMSDGTRTTSAVMAADRHAEVTFRSRQREVLLS